MQIWDPEQFKQFINVVNDPLFAALFKTLYLTGIRKGEALALTWKDIDFEKKLSIYTKVLHEK